MNGFLTYGRALAAAVAVTLVVAACGATGTEETAAPVASPSPTPVAATPSPEPTADLAENARLARRGGVLVLANRGDPPAAFDPMRTSSIALHHPGGGLYGPGNLVFRCRENIYLVCPGLASDWTVSPDFTEWTFTLRSGAVWHDGEPFTGADVAFWFELAAFGIDDEGRVRAPAYFRGDLGLAAGDPPAVETLPFRQVRVRLAEPNPYYLEVLMNPRLKIAHPEHLLRPLIDAGDLSAGPIDVGLVGTGPFLLDGYEPSSVLRLRRFDGYWERDAQGEALPYLDGIDFVITPDAAAMDAAFRTGRLDGGARGEGPLPHRRAPTRLRARPRRGRLVRPHAGRALPARLQRAEGRAVAGRSGPPGDLAVDRPRGRDPRRAGGVRLRLADSRPHQPVHRQ